MLAQDTSFGFCVPGSNTTIEISAERLREVLGQVEVELYHSEVYRRAVGNLQQMPAKGVASAQFLMKAIGREAIRLTLRHFVRQQVGLVEAEPGVRSGERELDEFPVAAFSRALGARVATLPTPAIEVIETTQPAEPVASAPMNAIATLAKQASAIAPKKLSKKLSQADAEQVVQERQLCLQQIGEEIRKARESRSMSLSQLHNKTLVPIHQLQALEAGHGSHLPEDVYLRGFIKRIGTVLELDNASLLESLPKPDPTQAVLPSWYHPSTKSTKGFTVQPIHLYLGYAALMVGGLVWLSHQSVPETSPGAIQLDAPNVTTAPDHQTQSSNSGTHIAPPERF